MSYETLLTEAQDGVGVVTVNRPSEASLSMILVSEGRAIEMILTGLVIERLAQAVLFTSEDKREGTSAFIKKRKPDFKGR